jgi:hypothetical protein
MKHILAAVLFSLAGISGNAIAAENQYYTSAEVFESVPIFGKSSVDCLTCADVVVGYKLGIKLVQKHQHVDKPIIFDIVSRTPVKPGTWVKVGLRLDLVVPVKVVDAYSCQRSEHSPSGTSCTCSTLQPSCP